MRRPAPAPRRDQNRELKRRVPAALSEVSSVSAGNAAPRPVIALTVGDPAGIGPEVVEKALRDPALPRDFHYEIVLPSPGFPPGKSTPRSARFALKALNLAVKGWKAGRYAAIVTGPVQKETIAHIQPDFIGQTEFFARACGLPDEAAVMVLTDPKLTVALTTTHCSLRQALKKLTIKRVVTTAQRVHEFLQKRGIAHPRLALAGVNPHAGENGLFGDEEQRILAPARDALLQKGISTTGPESPDTLFYHAAGGAYDAVICAYHDQGLIPFKLLAFHTGVNVTLGLPIIRTSPDHGTALGLAGKNLADHHSLLAAVQLAGEMVMAGREQSRKIKGR